MEKLIGLTRKDVTETVFICGDPKRVREIAAFLNSSKAIAENREYVSWGGSLNGVKTLVISHGIGASGAAICIQELIDMGARTIVRIGTAGSFIDEHVRGDVFIPTGAFRLDGTSRLLVESEYPAVPDFELISKIYNSVVQHDSRVRYGLVVTSDLFYSAEAKFKSYKQLNVEAIDMETSVLFVLGLLNKVKTASVLFFDGNPIKWNSGDYDPHSDKLKESMSRVIPLILNAAIAAK